MNVFFSDADVDRLIREDLPYFDLTTAALGLGQWPGVLEYRARHATVACATEEAVRVCTRCGAIARESVPSGTALAAGDLLLRVEGPAEALHAAWRIALNLMEHASGIASRARSLVEAARSVSSRATVVATRKVFPGTKSLAVKAVAAGGAFPHRLGLSETILIFKQHRQFVGGIAGLRDRLPGLRQQFPEKKVCVEVETPAEARAMAAAGADLLQLDKLPADKLAPLVAELRAEFPALKLAAAGGLTLDNIRDYAATDVDLLVTSWPYFGKPADIGATMTPREAG